MITCYFGIPGAGKTTLLTKFAINELKRIEKGKSKYKRVYTNFHCLGTYRIEFADLEKYLFEDSLILLDELMLDADNRGFMKFPLGIRDFLTLHRHAGVDIIYATQAYDKVDAKIRALTQDLWYMSKTCVPLLSEFTVCKRIYRNIVISEFSGDLLMGYRFCNLIERFFASNCQIVFRRRWYKYFDSFELGVLAKRPMYTSSLWDEPLPKFNVISYLNKLKERA